MGKNTIHSIILNIAIFIILLISVVSAYITYTSHTISIESYTDSIKSDLSNAGGFYSMLFFMINHAIYSKQNNKDFIITTDHWSYKYDKGWEDYFEPYEIGESSSGYYMVEDYIVKSHQDVLGDYSIQEYKTIIPSIYKYNAKTQDCIRYTKMKLGINSKNYDSIFIRRGDKLISGESKYYSADKYIDLLIKKNPFVKTVFVQTDDYTCIDEMNEYINKINIKLEILTLCKPSQRGVIVMNIYKDMLSENKTKSKGEKESENINKNKENLSKSKTVEDMNPDELYDHTITMITGIDIVCKSNICVTDYESNVGRFIKLFHTDSTKVYNITNPDADIDYTHVVCPAYSF